MRATAVAVGLGIASVMTQSQPTRGLEATSSFVFDGTNSDIAQQLYIRHKAGDTDAKVSISTVPTTVTKRLNPLGVSFDDLPRLVQRDVLCRADLDHGRLHHGRPRSAPSSSQRRRLHVQELLPAERRDRLR
ncbi:hypothetical protein PR003_g7971 [Phytophthora rubi]|uniref:Uncharacterized protein n=1 Tax=Phytophthora rubi TaxID=129364 RepID=A0A6A4FKT1_9STRA|nr:hypothetical protein PR002_g20586 [Phytophthora rubi]KAE9039824.1 hypothetical protein PR001_g7354 [Phytophthora rubi]KAE9345401.1 hypothetical protein PR003_g7971 [Phytophthora rubi]